jgi:hypothetical protein
MKVMARAWEIAREGQSRFGGKVREYLSASLKMAWAESRKPVITTESLIRSGWKLWEKGTMRRLYVNASVLGLECTYYASGNIHTATFDGCQISNHQAYGMKCAKTYIDLTTNTLHSDNWYTYNAACAILGLEGSKMSGCRNYSQKIA